MILPLLVFPGVTDVIVGDPLPIGPLLNISYTTEIWKVTSIQVNCFEQARSAPLRRLLLGYLPILSIYIKHLLVDYACNLPPYQNKLYHVGFSTALTYFATAISYMCKKFIKLTPLFPVSIKREQKYFFQSQTR